MKLVYGEYKIGERAIHKRTESEGVIKGITKPGEELMYLFDCDKFKQWITADKLESLRSAEPELSAIEEEVQYKSFDLHLVDSRGATTVLVRVSLANELEYEVAFNRADYCKARALYDFIQSQDTISESFLSMIGLERTNGL